MNICVVGLQWGDEGKGKVVDILAEKMDVVVRYGGGANAGHTVVVGDEKFALHLLPSGAVRPGTMCVIGNGVVVDPEILIGEIDKLAGRGILLDGRLFISENAHVVLDYHKKEDNFREQYLGSGKIGTTSRGIGPCYADKAGRSYAVRMGDLTIKPDVLRDKISVIIKYKNQIFSTLYGAPLTSSAELFDKCVKYSKRLKPYICDTSQLLHTAIKEKKSVLFEGAQGSMLDIDHGTFPYVTSSNSSSLGMPAGCGVPAKMVNKFVGVIKAYTTRVGSGPFPSELNDSTGDCIRQRGNEYGTTTGRPRRCGWFDAMPVRYAAAIGGIDEVAMMHLDTLSGIKKLKVCCAYKINGKQTDWFPTNMARLAGAECVYKTLAGWKQEISDVQKYTDLPKAARDYVEFIEKAIGVPVKTIGVGPARTQVINRGKSSLHG